MNEIVSVKIMAPLKMGGGGQIMPPVNKNFKNKKNVYNLYYTQKTILV